MGETGGLDLLKIQVKDSPMDVAAVDATARRLGAWLQARGRRVERIQVPPPGMHPHQGQMTAVLVMMVAFSFLALALSVVLVATLVGGSLSASRANKSKKNNQNKNKQTNTAAVSQGEQSNEQRGKHNPQCGLQGDTVPCSAGHLAAYAASHRRHASPPGWSRPHDNPVLAGPRCCPNDERVRRSRRGNEAQSLGEVPCAGSSPGSVSTHRRGIGAAGEPVNYVK